MPHRSRIRRFLGAFHTHKSRPRGIRPIWGHGILANNRCSSICQQRRSYWVPVDRITKSQGDEETAWLLISKGRLIASSYPISPFSVERTTGSLGGSNPA